MKTFVQRVEQHFPLPLRLSMSILRMPFVLTALIVLVAAASQPSALAQASSSASKASPVVRARIAGDVNSAELTQLPGSKLPRAQAQFDSGRLAGSTKLQGISIYFSRSQSQQADLQALMAAQQTPGSPLYHQWLNPDQFAARFGMADADIAKVQNWLERQGFAVDSVNRSKNAIRFSGTAAQVEAAFATEMHTYAIKTGDGVQNHFAPSTELSVPSALAGVVLGIRNLDNFRPISHVVLNKNKTPRPKPAFTGSDSSLFFAPGDIAVEYDLNKEYNSSFTGTGQSIAVVGQSEILLSDIENFQNAAGLPVKDPTLVLVPGSGSPAFSAGDWTESDLDLEWSGAIGKGATISLVYVGNSPNYMAFDALQYAIDNKIANIISSSYGECEAYLAGSTLGSGAPLESTLESAFQQAATQGQTIMSAAGDTGSTDCFIGETGPNLPTLAEQEVLGVDYPGSSAYVLSVGGTEISQANADYLEPGKGYWTASNNSTDIVTSVLQYIPEQAWNEDSAQQGLASGGGGASMLFPKPAWQTGVPGIPADGQRDVPDIALNASIEFPGYLYCTSDTSSWDIQDGQESSCTSGFRDSASGILTSAGGTSFAAPIFAGMLSLINQQQGYTTGQGLINSTLYTLASNSTTYASAFHDIPAGSNNKCLAVTGDCSSAGESEYSTTAGYDQATGLGTIDLFNLATAWPANSGIGTSLIATSTTVTASNSAPTVNVNDTFTITVAPDTGSGVPTGTVTITVDSLTPITETLSANGTYVYTTSFATAGAHVVLASYSGDSTYAASTGSATANVGVVNSGTGSFTISATNITVAQGAVGSSTITVTPAGGYTGTVQFGITTTSTTLADDTCPVLNNLEVSGTAPVMTTLTIDTDAANCQATGEVRKGKGQVIHTAGIGSGLSGPAGPVTGLAVLAGLLLAGILGRYSRKLRVLAGVILLATLGMAFTGCGSSSNSTTIPNAPKGTYTLTLTGTDASSTTIPVATTTFTLTIN